MQKPLSNVKEVIPSPVGEYLSIVVAPEQLSGGVHVSVYRRRVQIRKAQMRSSCPEWSVDRIQDPLYAKLLSCCYERRKRAVSIPIPHFLARIAIVITGQRPHAQHSCAGSDPTLMADTVLVTNSLSSIRSIVDATQSICETTAIFCSSRKVALGAFLIIVAAIMVLFFHLFNRFVPRGTSLRKSDMDRRNVRYSLYTQRCILCVLVD
jgi:hypothetical protein